MADGLLNKASIILTPTGYKAGTLYNVAPVVEPYEDFDFARASVASRVNSSGLVEMVGRTIGSELVTNGDFATNLNNWQTSSWWTWNVLGAYHPPTNLHKPLYQQTCEVGKTYRISFDLNVLQGSAKVSIGTNTGSTTQVFATNLDSGSYIYDITAQDEYIIFNRNNVSGNNEYYVDNVSIKEIIDTNNIPRISYDSNGDNGHILLEPTSTNLVTYSEDFSQWAAQIALSIGLNQGISPNGSTEANLLSIGIDSSSTRHRLYNLYNFVSGDTYTYSIFAKKNENDWFQLMFSPSAFDTESYANFDLNNGVVGNEGTSTTANITYYGNGWYRCSITCTASASVLTTYEVLTTNNTNSGRYPSYQSSSAVNVCFLWGAQLEELSYATSYIPTLTGSTETRATETATGAGSADLINSTEGVLYAEIAAFDDDDTSYRAIFINDGTNNNRVGIRYSNTSNQIQALSYKDGSLQGFGDYTLSNSEQFNKIAFKYKANDFALWINGVEVDTDTSGDVYTVGTLNNIDFSAIGGQNFYGKCKALAVFNEALSDAELNNLTG